MKAKLLITAFTCITQLVIAQVNIQTNIPAALVPGTFDAEVKIIKDPSNTFAKYQMDVTQGISVTAIDIKDGNFSFDNQRAKIIWVATPELNEIVIRLRFNIDASTVSPASITQKFTYMAGDNRKEVEVLPIIVNIGADAVAKLPAAPAATNTVATTTPAKTTAPAGNTKPAAATTPTPKPTTSPAAQPAAAAPTTHPAAATPAPAVAPAAANGATTYKVQIGSFGNQQPPKGKFAGVDGVTIENVGGVYKAVVGNCKTKEEALQLKDKLQAQGFPGFLVVYNNGVRAK